MGNIKSVAVFAGSSFGLDDCFRKSAEELGRAIGEKKIKLIYGGGAKGLMGVVSRCASENSEVIGVLPESMNIPSVVKEMNYGRLVLVKNMHERKKLMYDLSDGFIALPGGIGTVEELAEIYTWRQLEYHQKNIALLNTNGFWDPFIEFLDKATALGFISEKVRDLLIVESDAEKLLYRMNNERKAIDHKL
mgnify:FL=1